MYQHIAGELHGSPLARLALETLGSFNFGPIGLLEFAREHVLQWLDDADISVRKAAALCAARILNRHVTETKRPARHLVRRRAGPKHAQSRVTSDAARYSAGLLASATCSHLQVPT